MVPRIAFSLISLGFLAFVATASAEDERKPDPGYERAAVRAEAMLETAHERLLELRDGIPPRHKHSPPAGNNFKDARARAEAIIADYQKTHDPELEVLQPGAHTVMGRAHLALAGDAADGRNPDTSREAFENARGHYLNVLVQFRGRKEYQEEAIYFIGYCYDQLKDCEPGGQQMAIYYWLALLRDYPEGSFAKQAARDLERLGYPHAK